jgi:hypothetical protein
VAKAVAGGMAVKTVAPAVMVATEVMAVMVAASVVMVAVAVMVAAVEAFCDNKSCMSSPKSLPGSRTRSMWCRRIRANQIDSSSHPSTGDRAACHDS